MSKNFITSRLSFPGARTGLPFNYGLYEAMSGYQWNRTIFSVNYAANPHILSLFIPVF